jgi:hypothetical protein
MAISSFTLRESRLSRNAAKSDRASCDKLASFALAEIIVKAGAPVVHQLQTVGYDPESGCYVFKHFLITGKGEFLLPNKHGFFEVSHTVSIRPAPHSAVSARGKPENKPLPISKKPSRGMSRRWRKTV